MNEKFKEYTDKGFEFEIYRTSTGVFTVDVYFSRGYTVEDVHCGDNLDHAFAACDLFLEGE